jgi:hypothetical protein
MTDRFLCGWRLRSAVQLPELAAWCGENRVPDVEVQFGTVPHSLGDGRFCDSEASEVSSGTSIEIASDGTTMLTIAGIARFLVADGQRVTIETSQPADESAIRLYLLGTVLAILSFQRGLLPLHASCLALDAGAVAIAGDSGAGKSTLAATLALRGVTILADDVCVVDTSAPGGPLAWPTVSRIKLWHDSLDRLGLQAAGMEQVRKGIDKYALCEIPTFQTDPVPLAALYHITREAGVNEETPQAVSGIAAGKLLHRSVYRSYIGKAIGREHNTTRALMTILATVPVFSMSHNPNSAEMSPLPGIILEHQRHIVVPIKAS